MRFMKEDLKKLLSDRGNKYAVFLALGLIFLGLTLFLIKVWSLPPLVPLFYNRPWGLSQLTEPNKVLFFLLFALGTVILNVVFSLRLSKEIVLLTRILLWVSVLISLLATTAVIRILFLVT